MLGVIGGRLARGRDVLGGGEGVPGLGGLDREHDARRLGDGQLLEATLVLLDLLQRLAALNLQPSVLVGEGVDDVAVVGGEHDLAARPHRERGVGRDGVGEAQRLDPVIAAARDLHQRELAFDVRALRGQVRHLVDGHQPVELGDDLFQLSNGLFKIKRINLQWLHFPAFEQKTQAK